MKYETRTIDFKSIKEMPSEERPRERLMASGPLGISDLELLCLIIGSGNKNRPVQDIAQDILYLLNSKGSCGVSIEDISSIAGVGKANASRICAEFGGGGHGMAAGCTVKGSREEVTARLMDVVARHWHEAPL